MFGSARKQQTRQFLLKILHAVLPNAKKIEFYLLSFKSLDDMGLVKGLGLFPSKSEAFEYGQII